MRTPEAHDWVSAIEAAKLLAPRFGGIGRAKNAIATALHEGLLHAGAEYACDWGGDGPPREITATVNEIIEVPPEAWTASEHYEADQLYWDWDSGWFEVWSRDGEQDSAFAGVSFSIAELDRLDPTLGIFKGLPEEGGAQTKAPSRGPRPSLRWSALIQAVLELERDGELMTGHFDGPGKLMDAVQLKIPEHLRFEDRSIEGVISYLYQHLLCGPPQKLT